MLVKLLDPSLSRYVAPGAEAKLIQLERSGGRAKLLGTIERYVLDTWNLVQLNPRDIKLNFRWQGTIERCLILDTWYN